MDDNEAIYAAVAARLGRRPRSIFHFDKIQLDASAKAGTLHVIIATATIDFAHDKLNAHVSGPEMLDVAKYPTAEYSGKFVEFAAGAPKTISGADATGTFNRADFGVNYGHQYGFKQDVLLRIQVEGIRAN